MRGVGAMNARLVSQGMNLDLEIKPGAAQLLLPARGEMSGASNPALALEKPDRYPRLEQCVTPDDRVVICGDLSSLSFPGSISAVVDRLKMGMVSVGNITLLIEDGVDAGREELLKDQGLGLRIVRHDPANASDSCYLATLRNGKRAYLNRALLESDYQVFIGSPCRGTGGALVGPEVPILAGLMMPQASGEPFDSDELQEVGTLLGNPYFLVMVDSGGEGAGGCSWWAGGWESAGGAKRAHRSTWRARAEAEAEVVVVGTGLSGGSTFPEWCRIVKKAWRLVTEQGKLILVAGEAKPDLSMWSPYFERAGEPGELLEKIRGIPKEMRCLGWWARAAEKAQIHVLSGLGEQEVTAMFAQSIATYQIRSIVSAAESVAFIGDFSKAIVGAPIV